MASNTGAIIVECEATEITLRHYRCGQVDESDRASSILVECTHCKEEYDQDESAALNVLASATMPQDRQGPLAAE
jgi:transposase